MTPHDKTKILDHCKELLEAYRTKILGDCVMPEDSSPYFTNNQPEQRLAYFTLPMSLNYQRDSYKLWQAALHTWEDKSTQDVFSMKNCAAMADSELRAKLLIHKLAIQPNKHVSTWHTIAKTIIDNWGSLTALFMAVDNDFLKLKEIVQGKFKKGFPYLSGPKIFNYWSFIISSYGRIPMTNRQFIEIAPDTHIIKCSVKLGVITTDEAEKLSREEISKRWRDLLDKTDISPIDMHPPLWFWSRNGFTYKLSPPN